MTRILMVDDQILIRAGLSGLLTDAGLVLAGEAANGREGILAARRLRPDVILMDLRMPVMDGVSAIKEIRADDEISNIPILVLTTFDGDQDVIAAIHAGADGFISKAADPAELFEAIRRTARGEPAVSSAATRVLMRKVHMATELPRDEDLQRRVASLTSRERDVVRAAAMGLDNQQIARRMFISPLTVKTHINRAMTKLDARERGQLVALAYQSGITSP